VPHKIPAQILPSKVILPILAFFEVVRQQLETLLDLGAMTVVDEAIYSYYGDDMREDATDIKIEGKPHSYGILNYLATQSLELSGVSVVVDFEPQLPTHKPTARSALLSLTQSTNLESNQGSNSFLLQ